MPRPHILAALAAAPLLAAPLLAPLPAQAQAAMSACETEQDLQQILNSDGSYMPDKCRQLTISVVRSDNGPLCVIDFSGGDDNFLQQLKDAAIPQKWWVKCADLQSTDAPAGAAKD